MLTEYKNKHFHYYLDDRGRRQGEYKYRRNNSQLGTHCYYKDDERHGEYKWWNSNGGLRKHCYYKDGERHGEYKWWYSDGQIEAHCYYKDDKDITTKIVALVDDFNNITKEEKVLINLKFGIKCLK